MRSARASERAIILKMNGDFVGMKIGSSSDSPPTPGSPGQEEPSTDDSARGMVFPQPRRKAVKRVKKRARHMVDEQTQYDPSDWNTVVNYWDILKGKNLIILSFYFY